VSCEFENFDLKQALPINFQANRCSFLMQHLTKSQRKNRFPNARLNNAVVDLQSETLNSADATYIF
jgi:hypothetical protein